MNGASSCREAQRCLSYKSRAAALLFFYVHKQSDWARIASCPVYRPWRNGYLPIRVDSGGSCFMSFSPDTSSRTTWKTNL